MSSHEVMKVSKETNYHKESEIVFKLNCIENASIEQLNVIQVYADQVAICQFSEETLHALKTYLPVIIK